MPGRRDPGNERKTWNVAKIPWRSGTRNQGLGETAPNVFLQEVFLKEALGMQRQEETGDYPKKRSFSRGLGMAVGTSVAWKDVLFSRRSRVSFGITSGIEAGASIFHPGMRFP